MEFLFDFLMRFVAQFQSPTLGFLIGGMVIAALGSNLKIPNAIYQFIVFMLLMKMGIKGGIEIREADLNAMLLPAVSAVIIGITIVLIGSFFFSLLPGIKREDGIATAGLFGAVSASTLAAAMVLLEEEAIHFEAWVPALYPFMDIPALILAIVLANIHLKKQNEGKDSKVDVWGIVKESLRGSALSALILGLALGLLTKSDGVLDSFYEPLFSGFLSVLMLVMGMEAYARINELRRVAHLYAVYAFFGPIIHGLMAFGLGYIAHVTVGFSPGGVILLAVIAASSSDISGPPTLRGGIPSANPSTYIGASTSVGTPVAIAVCIPLFIALAQVVFDL
ncbi:sodium-dependent bicarbonate transport family permease [Anaerobacillus isosaccharinicus]|uniref:Sodium-dependent bicarbonate transport family permease n=1 Tax=Anaerobacillus isosaccharinicus TaxID=1532552 RepID=A0A1S2L496_9BACI|nr:sodium-dependent bicarbonate transport family permease [Anaerobacillus isosaccharinicus]MBA5585193.1 sodium-dependent bicarbonate transport family permease [Anaerobacillus isosaccharinicus]QOY36469.1 sodium-dependent bicarbonate transport family permease [Anaerobacillus isosaccharinicus]